MPEINVYRAATISSLHDLLTNTVLSSKNTVPTAGTSIGLTNVVGVADSCLWEYDLSTLWLTESRWQKLVSQYLDPIQLENWLQLIERRLRKSRANVATMRTNVVKSDLDRSIVTRRFGSCMNHISYTSRPKPQITLNSRSCYLGYMSGLDLTFAFGCAKLAADAAGRAVEEIGFVWNLEIGQFNSERGLGYFLAHHDRAVLRGNSLPLGNRRLKETLKYLDDLDEKGIFYEDMKFASRRKLRQRYHLQVFGADYSSEFGSVLKPLPTLMTSNLELL